LHQRCWVHFLRDGHELKEKYPHDEHLHRWAASVKAIYEQAVAWTEQELDPNLSPRQRDRVRVAQHHAFEQRLWKLCQPHAHTTAPQHTLCERVEQFLPELFVFVAVPGVPAHNDVVAYCTPSAWLACFVRRVWSLFVGWRKQRNPTAIGLIHGNATSSPPIPDRLWTHSIGLCGFTGG